MRGAPSNLVPFSYTRARKPARTSFSMMPELKTCTLLSFVRCPTGSCLARVPSGTIGNGYQTATLAELAPMLDGKPHERERAEITLRELGEKFRMQKIVFAASSEIFDQMKPTWKGSREFLLAQLIRLVESYIGSGKIQVHPPIFDRDDFRRRIVITMNKVVQHIWQRIRFENSLVLEPVFD